MRKAREREKEREREREKGKRKRLIGKKPVGRKGNNEEEKRKRKEKYTRKCEECANKEKEEMNKGLYKVRKLKKRKNYFKKEEV